jgi:hypothetical protein
MGEQERQGCLMQELVRHAAEQPFSQPSVPVTAHDDEVGLAPAGFGYQRRSDIAMVALYVT